MDRLGQLKAKLSGLGLRVLPEEPKHPGGIGGAPVTVRSVATTRLSAFLFEINALLRLKDV